MAKKAYPLRVDESLFYKFQKVAEFNHRTIVGHLEHLMEKAVKDHEKENGIIDL